MSLRDEIGRYADVSCESCDGTCGTVCPYMLGRVESILTLIRAEIEKVENPGAYGEVSWSEVERFRERILEALK